MDPKAGSPMVKTYDAERFRRGSSSSRRSLTGWNDSFHDLNSALPPPISNFSALERAALDEGKGVRRVGLKDSFE